MYQYQQFAILLRGGGDIATGIALRLYRSGFRRLIILETAHPMAVRRRVAFSEAVYEGLCTVEGITAALAPRPEEIAPLWDAGCIPVMIPDLIPASAQDVTKHIFPSMDALLTHLQTRAFCI